MAGIIGHGIQYKAMTTTSLDLNDITPQSTYLVYASCPNSPNGFTSYGWLTTLPSFDERYGSQFLLSHEGVFYFRVKNAGTWGTWRKVTFTTV